ncbi:hypothetical protein ACOSP7_032192 [Xanthoceras sorbifolium]
MDGAVTQLTNSTFSCWQNNKSTRVNLKAKEEDTCLTWSTPLPHVVVWSLQVYTTPGIGWLWKKVAVKFLVNAGWIILWIFFFYVGDDANKATTFYMIIFSLLDTLLVNT